MNTSRHTDMKHNAEPYSLPEEEAATCVAEEAVVPVMPQQIVLDVPRGYNYAQLQSKVNAFYIQLLKETSTEEQFHRLLSQWELETGILSNPLAVVKNTNFMEIVNIGKDVVPYILDEISNRPSLLYRALEMIYGETLSLPKADGAFVKLNIKDSCEAWIEKLRK